MMARKITNCAQFRDRITDAAADLLSAGLRSDFEAHTRDCAACRQEFRRMQALLQAINTGVSASVAGEPSPQLMAGVRRRIAEQPCRAPVWLPRSGWLTVVGAFAALAIALFAARTWHEFNRAVIRDRTIPVVASATSSHSATPPTNRGLAAESAASTPYRKPLPAMVRRSSQQVPRRLAPEPEIIVEPGQMRAILRFAAASQSGQINGAKLLADQKKATDPLAIKPLTIAPLKIAALADDAASPSSGSSEGGDKNFVGGRSD